MKTLVAGSCLSQKQMSLALNLEVVIRDKPKVISFRKS